MYMTKTANKMEKSNILRYKHTVMLVVCFTSKNYHVDSELNLLKKQKSLNLFPRILLIYLFIGVVYGCFHVMF